jgi:predicted deacylase
MRTPTATWILTTIPVLFLIGIGAFLWLHKAPPPPAAPVVAPAPTWPATEVIGTSTEGRAITAYTYGTGPTELLFVGGMHGGYEWNAVLLAYQFMDYLKANPGVVPASLSVTVIPSLNPDGVFKVTGSEGRFTLEQVSPDAKVDAAGRFTADGVDLNRNFDCNWQATSTWQGRPVSAGTGAFSEPEARALRSFVTAHPPVVAVFWHSAAGTVYASECNGGILPGTLIAMSTYATAAKYPAVKSFDAYPITGDSEGWLASINIPAITVELATHQSVEWNRNLAGITALLNLYGGK